MWGIGFKTADTIAQAVGIPHDSPQRVKAGLQYTLSEAADDGHCYLPEPNLIADAAKILEVDRRAGRAPAWPSWPPPRGWSASRSPTRRDGGTDPGGLPGAVPPGRDLPGRPAAAPAATAPADRLPAFADVDWDKALAWLHGRTGAELAPEQAAGGPAGADRRRSRC